MKTIYKYPLNSYVNKVNLPAGGTPLVVACQDGEIHLWCEVETDEPKEHRLFYVYPTGGGITDNREQEYIGTVFKPSGLVFHVYAGKDV